MERRPKPRIWNGEDYESDHDEDDKPPHMANFDDHMMRQVHTSFPLRVKKKNSSKFEYLMIKLYTFCP